MKVNIDNLQSEIDISVILDAYVYMDTWDSSWTGEGSNHDFLSLQEIVNNIRAYYGDAINLEENKEIKTYLDILDVAMTKNPELRKIELIDQSPIDSGTPSTELIACTFKYGDDYYIAYRGTGDGKWVDNGDALSHESSLMQIRAAQYFDYIAEKYNLEDCSGNIIVTGHSKGGNLAQYVTFAAKYAELVDKCYSLDGQGFSQKAIDYFKTIWGEDYEEQLKKMYSICGENDYVHDLGIVIISEDQTYIVPTSGNDFVSWHELDNMINADGTLNWNYIDGAIDYNYPQGPIGRFVKEFSEKLMTLDNESIDDCSVAVMSLLEFFNGDYKKGTGDREFATIEEFLGLLFDGSPVLINTAIESENTVEVLALLGVDQKYIDLFSQVQDYVKKNNITDFAGYIAEDPLRLIEIYSSLDLGKVSVNDAIRSLFNEGGISSWVASFVTEHPFITGIGISALSNPLVISFISKIVAGSSIALIANHIWQKICEKSDFFACIDKKIEFIQEKVLEFYSEIKHHLRDGINICLDKIFSTAEMIVNKVSGHINSYIDNVHKFFVSIKDKAIAVAKNYLFNNDFIFYMIASNAFGRLFENVTVNITKLNDCVDALNRLAVRVINMDERLDSLYSRLAVNNIKEDEGIFTSIANMYNLFRADLNVDEGRIIKRKANALTELFGGYRDTENWICNNLPKKI